MTTTLTAPLLPLGVYRSRRSFAVMVRQARAAGTLTRYEQDRRMGRTAVLSDGTVLTYESQYQAMLRAS